MTRNVGHSNYKAKGYNHRKIRDIFSLDRKVMLSDL